MKVTLSAMQQRWLAIGLFGLVLIAFSVFILVPVWDASARQQERVVMLREQATKLRALVDAAPRFQAAAREMANNPDVQALAFAGEPGVAVAELQATLTRLFAGAGATVMSGQAVAQRADAPSDEVAVQVTVETDIASLVQALHAVGSSRPLLKIESLSVREPDAEWAAATPVGPPPNVANKLIVEIIVSAQTRRAL